MKKLKIAITGCMGKMGLELIKSATKNKNIEIVALTERETSVEEVNSTIEKIAANEMNGILGITHDPVVSMDMKADERSSIVDGQSTNVIAGDMVKIAAWYDNEWGYACRLSDLCALVVEKGLS